MKLSSTLNKAMALALISLVAGFSVQATMNAYPGAASYYENTSGYDPTTLHWLQQHTNNGSNIVIIGAPDLARWINALFADNIWIYPLNLYTVPASFKEKSAVLENLVNSGDPGSWSRFLNSEQIEYILCKTPSYCNSITSDVANNGIAVLLGSHEDYSLYGVTLR